jgi:AAA ATPase-like protein
VNIASRLAGKAAASELLISDTLRGLVRTSTTLPMTERGPLELKGVSEPVRAWSVRWQSEEQRTAVASPPMPAPARRAAPTGQFLCPVVVGRSTESAAFTERLDQAAEGAGSTVMLGGEAGVGKSAFVRQATDLALTRGFRVLNGLTHQSDAGLPYGPFVSAVRSGFRGLDRDELGRVLQRSAPDLAELFPELGRTARAEPTGIERHRLSVAFQHLLRSFTREAPVLLVLEDLHWADEASLELLLNLARELRDARILILATYRSDEMHRRHPLLRALAELQRERLVTEIALKRLTPDETRELIRATFAPTHPTITVSTEFRDVIYARSEGNPFFTEELLKALVESGGIYYTEGSGWDRKPIGELEIPGSIREAVRARAERLSPEARTTLSAAAVIGLQFSFDLLRTVLAADERALEEHLREFIEAQLVLEAGDGDDAYAFRHALTREVVYDDLLVRERKRLHRSVAHALERSRDVEPSLLALHLLAAGERERAVPHLLSAGDRARRADAPREAVAHYERAVDIGVPDEQLPNILERIAEAYHLFDEHRSLEAARESEAAYRERGDVKGRSRMLRLASRNQWIGGEGEAATKDGRAAIDVLDGEASVELAQALAQFSTLRMTAGANTEAIAAADRAITLGERLGDVWSVANALISKGSALSRGNEIERGLEDIERGRRLAVEHGLAATAARGWNNAVIWGAAVGWPLARRTAFLREGLEWTRAHGIERATLSWLKNQYGWALASAADFDAALTVLDESAAEHTYMGGGPRASLRLARFGPAAVREDALRYGEMAARIGDPQAFVPLVIQPAIALTLLGDRAAAGAWIDRLRARAGEEGVIVVISEWFFPMVAGLALIADAPDLLDLVEGPSPSGGLYARYRFEVAAAARAVMAGDLVGAAAAFDRFREQMAENALYPLLALPYLALRTEGRLADVPQWRASLRWFREMATRAKAHWWLEVVPEPRT